MSSSSEPSPASAGQPAFSASARNRAPLTLERLPACLEGTEQPNPALARLRWVDLSDDRLRRGKLIVLVDGPQMFRSDEVDELIIPARGLGDVPAPGEHVIQLAATLDGGAQCPGCHLEVRSSQQLRVDDGESSCMNVVVYSRRESLSNRPVQLLCLEKKPP